MTTFTLLHVAISLLAIASGLIVTFGFLTSRGFAAWNAFFLATTIATSLTGFGFPFDHLLPSHKVGILSLVVLAIAVVARYARHLAGAWRRVYVITSELALYLNVFVLVVQLFLKVPALHALAPQGNEPPFLVAQVVVLVLFLVVGTVATIKARNPAPRLG